MTAMGRFVTLDGAPTGPAIHVADPGVPLEALIVDPLDVWRTQPAVRKVVDFIARNLASIPLHLYARDGEDSRKRVRDGALHSILGEPAPFTTPYRFWHTIHTDGLLWDRWAFVHLEADDEGPEQLFRLPPGRFRIQRGPYNEPQALIVWPKDGQEYRLDPAVAVFDSGYASAWNDVTPPIDALADTLYEASEARKYRRELLQRGARVDAVIERPAEQKWDDAAWERFRSQFAAYKAGGGQEGGVPILEDGMKYVKVEAFEPNKLETLEARKLTDAEVASFYHVPPEMVGAREGNFSNLDAFRQMLWNVTLGPQIVAWEQSLNVMLRPQFGRVDGQYIEAHVDAKLRGSFLEQAQAMQSSIGAPWMSRNEGRRMRNMPAVEDGDDLITPLNVIVGGLASPRDTGPSSGGHGGGGGLPAVDGSDADDIAKRVTAAAALIRSGFSPEASLIAVGLDPIEHLGLLPVTVQKPQEPENPDDDLIEEVTKARAYLRERDLLGKAPGRKAADTSQEIQQERDLLDHSLRALFAEQLEQVREAFPPEKGVKATISVYEALYTIFGSERGRRIISDRGYRMAEAGARDVLMEWNPTSAGFSPEQMEAWLAKAADTNTDIWADTLSTYFSDLILGPGWGDDLDYDAAEAIVRRFARTWGTQYLEFGRRDAARASGLTVKRWRTTSREPRPSHSAMNGTSVLIHERFPNGCDYPGDWSGGAEEVANCQCTVDYGTETAGL